MKFVLAALVTLIAQAASTETLLGTSAIPPGISLTFEVAARDTIYPAGRFLDEDQTDVHLEVLASWNQNAPSGFPIGGHVAYLVDT